MFNLNQNQINVGRREMYETIDRFVSLSNGAARDFADHEARFTENFFAFLRDVFSINFVNDEPHTAFDYACIIFNNPSDYYIFDMSRGYEDYCNMRAYEEYERSLARRKSSRTC